MLRNMTIAPKLGILVGVAMLGLCVAGGLASYLMQQEMYNARVEQTKSIVSVAKNMAGELKRQVDAGEMTKDQAMAMLRKLGNAMKYDNGSGYLFATG
jgi:methyl-accepting chemotaxis protein